MIVSNPPGLLDVPASSVPPGPVTATTPLVAVHTPKGVMSLNTVRKPAQTVVIPVIGAGSGLTVTVVVAMQPVVNEYVITALTPPGLLPVITPPLVIGADMPLLVLHPPPGVASVSEILEPTHTVGKDL